MDQTVIMISVIFGLGLVMMTAIGSVVIIAMKPRVRMKKRIDAIGSLSGPGGPSAKAESRRQKRIQDKVKSVGESKDNDGIIERIGYAMLQAGIQIEIPIFIMICAAIGIVAVVAYLITGVASPIYSPAVGIVAAVGLPKFWIGLLAKRRQNAFTKNFAEAIDVIVRGIRSGLPVGETLAIISREFHGPIGEEFTLIIEGQRLGMTIDDIMVRALKRLPTPEFKFFSIVLQIQRQTGGNLADTLENLSEVLRDRKRMKDKIQALSSEAKSSAMIIASLPFAVLLMLSIVNPTYVGILFNEGIHLIGIGLGMMAAGVFVMSKMINFEV